MDPYPGGRLLQYLSEEASFSSPYQPLLIAALIDAGGRAAASDLALHLLVNDQVLVDRSRRILMRWPLRTFRRRGIADYDTAAREFVLPAEFASDEERAQVLELCRRLAAEWTTPTVGRVGPSRRYRLIERAGGRCQACGAIGSQTLLDVDHIVPRAAARGGRVRLPDGRLVGVDEDANLQILCAACNRGKRALSTFDFRPTLERLAETMNAAAAIAAELGHTAEDLERARLTAAPNDRQPDEPAVQRTRPC